MLESTEYKGGHSRPISPFAPKPKHRRVHVHPELRALIDATKTVGRHSYLVTRDGNSYPELSFDNQFRRWCVAAGIRPEVGKAKGSKLPRCSPHRLRKAGATTVAMAAQARTN